MKAQRKTRKNDPKKVQGIVRNNPGPYKRPKRKPGRPRTKQDITLSLNEQLFCDLLLENMQRTPDKKMSQEQAYRIAFKNDTGSPNTIRSMASQLKKQPKIQDYIRKRKLAAAQKVEITISRVLQGLLRIAEFDPRQLYDKKGRPIPIHKLPDDVALAMNGFEVSRVSKTTATGRTKVTYYPKKVKTESRKPAWELLGTHLNMWNETGNQGSAEDFVNDLRDFADSITDAIPGGIL